MIEITYRIREYPAMVMQGHAGWSNPGTDIVCAACSILAYTLAENIVRMSMTGCLEDEPVIRMESGNVEIRCTARQEYSNAVELIFDTIWSGLRLLADTYPDYVKLTLVDTADADQYTESST